MIDIVELNALINEHGIEKVLTFIDIEKIPDNVIKIILRTINQSIINLHNEINEYLI